MKKRGSWRNSFGYAYEGIVYTVATQRNMRFHLCAAVATIIALAVLGLGIRDCLLILLAIALVMAAELINTALEKAVDLSTEEVHPLAKAAKDAAAGAVLVCAVFAVIAGLFVFYEPVINWLFHGMRSGWTIGNGAGLQMLHVVLALLLVLLLEIGVDAYVYAQDKRMCMHPVATVLFAVVTLLVLDADTGRGLALTFIILLFIVICLSLIFFKRAFRWGYGAAFGSLVSFLIYTSLKWMS